jgi:hypothetical protein
LKFPSHFFTLAAPNRHRCFEFIHKFYIIVHQSD